MSIPQEWYEEYRGLVKIVSAQWAFKYNDYVDKDDVAQELWMWLITRAGRVKEWEADETINAKGLHALVARSMNNAAYDYCLREKLAKTGVEFDDLFWYTPDFIKTMLPGALMDDWKKIRDLAADRMAAYKDASETGDWMAYVADLKKAFELLSEDEKTLVLEIYGRDQTSKDVVKKLHKAYGETRTAAALGMTAHRAVVKMSKFLGGLPPYKDRVDDEV